MNDFVQEGGIGLAPDFRSYVPLSGCRHHLRNSRSHSHSLIFYTLAVRSRSMYTFGHDMMALPLIHEYSPVSTFPEYQGT